MQLFVRNLAGSTTVLQVSPDSTVADLKAALEAKDGVPAQHQVLISGGKLLVDDQLPCEGYIADQATLHLSSRLRGGKPVKVKMVTNHLPCGEEVTIDIGPEATRDEIKRKLETVTGVPVEHQKVIMSNVNQLAMADKRTNITFSPCGTTSGVNMAVNKK